MAWKKMALAIALGVSAVGVAGSTASAKTENAKACFGQNTSTAVSEWGVSLKQEAADGQYASVGAMLQYFRADLPFGCPGD